MKFGTLADLT